MALKTDSKPATQTALADDSMLLELAMYQRYTRKGHTYLGGQVYKFKRLDALQLLTEMDSDRPIWKQHRKPAPKKQTASTTTIMDATAVSVERKGEPTDGIVPITITADPKKRIDVGTDEEIADILNPPPTPSSPEDVTV